MSARLYWDQNGIEHVLFEDEQEQMAIDNGWKPYPPLPAQQLPLPPLPPVPPPVIPPFQPPPPIVPELQPDEPKA